MTVQSAKKSSLTPLQKAALAVKEIRARLDQVEQKKREPIAIIGMACRFPCAEGIDEYWRLLSEGIDGISEVPQDRWDLEKYFDSNPTAPGKINTRYGGFIKGIDQFDASFFGISALEAERLDPQHRLLLEVTWHALEDAGQAPSELKGSDCGVFVGIAQNDYGVKQLAGPAEDIHAYTGTGNGFCFAAGRLAYTLGLNGPTFAVDTACSSSLVALHQAVQALRNGECETAIVAGAQLNLTPPMQVFFSKTQSFSPDGRCHTFDESADGFVLGEGVGVLVLRRESAAKKRGDVIHGLVRGSGINHDGASSGLTVPNEAAQEFLVRDVIEKCRLSPSAIDYVETHGTATELGDPIELGALRSVFGVREGSEALHVGSVKTNIGHLGAVAGIAGLIKTVLMMEKETIAPNLHFSQPSSRICWDDFSVKVPRVATPWRRKQTPRRAGISSFGLSGTNAHVLVEEAPVTSAMPSSGEEGRQAHLLTLSAHDEQALLALVQAYLDLEPRPPLADLAYSANTGRSHLAHRLIIKASTEKELTAALQSIVAEKKSPQSLGGGTLRGTVPRGGPGRLLLHFTDHLPASALHAEASKLAMLASEVQRCEALYRPLDLSPQQQQQAQAVAVQWALMTWLDCCGVTPEGVSGEGVGKLVAFCVAGMIDLTQAFLLLKGESVDLQSPQINVFCGEATPLDFKPVANYGFTNEPAAEVNPEALENTLSGSGYGLSLCVGTPQGIATSNHTEAGLSTDTLEAGLLAALAAIYQRGFDINWRAFDAGSPRNVVKLPLYPFQRKRHWLESDTLHSDKSIDVRINNSKNINNDNNGISDNGNNGNNGNSNLVHGHITDNSSGKSFEDSLVDLPKNAPTVPPAVLQEHAAEDAGVKDSNKTRSPTQTRSPTTDVTANAIKATQEQEALAVLLKRQLQSASGAINEVVAQQLHFLKNQYRGPLSEVAPKVQGQTVLQKTVSQKTLPQKKSPQTPVQNQVQALLQLNAANTSDGITEKAQATDDAITKPALTPVQEGHCLGEWHLLKILSQSDADTEAVVKNWYRQAAQARSTAQNNPINQSTPTDQNKSVGQKIHSDSKAVLGTGPVKSIFVYKDLEDAALALAVSAAKDDPQTKQQTATIDRKRLMSRPDAGTRETIFMFPGVGDHYLNMALGLYRQERVFREAVDGCCDLLQQQEGIDLRSVLYPKNPNAQPASSGKKPVAGKLDLRAMLGKTSAPVDPAEATLNQSIHSQPLVFIIEYALAKTWLARGLKPTAMIGYSIGEYTAACLAEVITVADALTLVAQRARLIQGMPQGVLLAVPLTEKRVKPLLNEPLSLSIVSTENQCVVGGPESQVAALETRLRHMEIVSRRLPTTHAFHSTMLAPLHQPIKALVENFTLCAPKIPYVSNVTGQWIKAEEATSADYWASHTWRTVRFSEGLDQLLCKDKQILLEVGPGQSLGSFVLQHSAHQKNKHNVVLPSLRNRFEPHTDEAFFLTTVGKLWLAGAEGL